jgi:hypothetical protein
MSTPQSGPGSAERITTPLRVPDPASLRRGSLGRVIRMGWLAVAALIAILALLLGLSAVQLLPRLHNPFAETTVDRSQPALLMSIPALSRYVAASGSFQVIVDLAKRSSFLPSFVEGTDTLFVGAGTDIAFVDFSGLRGKDVVVSPNRTRVTITLPPAQLEPAVLNVKQSYVFAEQQGLLNRIGNFFSSNPNNQRQVYIAAQQKIQAAARRSPLVAEAERNTTGMLTGLMHSLGFQHVTVLFKSS